MLSTGETLRVLPTENHPLPRVHAHPHPNKTPGIIRFKIMFVDIVFDGPPGPEPGRFVEVDTRVQNSSYSELQ